MPTARKPKSRVHPINSPRLAIVYRRAEELQPYEKNSRLHSPEQLKLIERSLLEFGWTNPLLLDGRNGIIAGHARLASAQALWAAGKSIRNVPTGQVPCIDLEVLTAAQKRAYIIADNALSLQASWDENLLGAEIGDLKGLGFDLSLLGFDDKELLDILGPAEGLTDPDEIPEPPAVPVSKTGDLWLLGAYFECEDCGKKYDYAEGLKLKECPCGPKHG